MTDPQDSDSSATGSSVITETVTDESDSAEEQHSESDVVLQPQISAAWALAPRHLGLLAVFCLMTMVLNYLPLRSTDIWGHVAYGHWILEHRQLPLEDPFASLTAGMRLIDSAWLSQVVFAWLERWGGAEALSATFTILSMLGLIAICRACYLQSRRTLVAFAGLLLTLLVGFSRLTTIRPETFGVAAFAILLWLLVRHGLLSRHHSLEENDSLALPERPAWSLYVGVFLTMCLWANFHGSFVCGLAVLGCLTLGRLAEASMEAIRSREGWAHVIGDQPLRRLLITLEVGIAATLLNPYGIDLLINSVGFSQQEILDDVLEWQPLQFLGIGGREFAASWIVITLALRHSRQRVRVGEALMLGLFAYLAASKLRMIGWYGAVVAVFLAPHLADIWNRFASPIEREPSVKERNNPLELTMGRSWTYSLIALLMIWIAFSLSPMARPITGDDPRQPEQLYDSSTPLAAAAYLNDHPPSTRVFNPQWWGDWLVWSSLHVNGDDDRGQESIQLPDTSDGPVLQPFVTTNMHLIPETVWRDYRRIMVAANGWDRAMRRYRMETAVLDKDRQSRLVRTMQRSSVWKTVFEDEQAVILQRTPESTAEDAETDALNEAELNEAELNEDDVQNAETRFGNDEGEN